MGLIETNRLQIKFHYKNVTTEKSSVQTAISLPGQTAHGKCLSDLVAVNSVWRKQCFLWILKVSISNATVLLCATFSVGGKKTTDLKDGFVGI